MDATTRSLTPWVTFAGCVLVVVVLHWAQDILVPIALAVLLTFVLTPPVTLLERGIGRVPAVLAVVTLVFTLLGLAGWGLAHQMDSLAQDLPRYRGNILAKIADVRVAGQGGTVAKVQATIADITARLGRSNQPEGTAARPIVVTAQPTMGLPGLTSWLSPIVGPLGTAGLVGAMVIFMLVERRALRDRLIGFFGQGHLAVTTRAIDEAGERVSRQLLMQSLVNLIYGVAAGVGLAVLGVPYALVWATLGAVLRFIPYLGPVLGAGAPILVSLAALQGWAGPLGVVALFVVLELFTNLVLETVLYAGAAGVSQVALLVSLAFWTWLWGPLGLLMATPLTVCLVVLGKHVRGLEFVGALMADTPALAPEYSYYQRLLARDQSEAADLLERHVRTEPARSVYDALLLPALNYAELDRLEQRLSSEEETAIVDATRELLADVAASTRAVSPAAAPAGGQAGRRTAPAASRAGLCRQRRRRRARARHARPSRRGSADRRRGARGTAACGGSGGAGAGGRRLGRLHRRSAAQPTVQDALSGAAAPCRAAGGAHRDRPLGPGGAGRREHAGAARGRREPGRHDAGGDPDVFGGTRRNRRVQWRPAVAGRQV